MDVGRNKNGTLLPWEKRYNIAIGIAEALNYLHNETKKPVIHRDVKSSNILLSNGFEPQVLTTDQTFDTQIIIKKCSVSKL